MATFVKPKLSLGASSPRRCAPGDVRWARIKEADNRYLRIVLLEDGKTVHNAFFDRRFKED